MVQVIPFLPIKERKESEPRRTLTIAGCMSGTSLDGIDIAVIKTDGLNILELGDSAYLPYPPAFQKKLREILGQNHITPEIVKITLELMDYHAQVFSNLKDIDSIDMVAIHGQTIFHDPRGNPPFTWQLCDPEYLQGLIKKTIVYDFRTEDVRCEGQGAPLAPIYHLALAQDLEKPVGFLNIGGVSNFTYLPSNDENTLYAGDMGPGNALINDYVERHFGLPYDKDGVLAASGTIHQELISKWLSHSFFKRPLPKSLDRDTFSDALIDVEGLLFSDAITTLSEFTVQAISRFLPSPLNELFVCGGGRKNCFIMERLRSQLPYPVRAIDEIGYDGDMLEAQAFAFLGARCYFGLITSFPKTTGVAFPVCGGRVLPLS